MGTLTASVALFLVSVALSPSDHLISEDVDLIEVNHFHDENGKLVFDQVIFYDWSPLEGRYQVRAWRLLKASEQLPTRNWKTGEYSAVWHDGDVLRKLRAPAMRETFTQYDPELAEREYLPKEKRRELVKIVAKAPAANTTAATVSTSTPPTAERDTSRTDDTVRR